MITHTDGCITISLPNTTKEQLGTKLVLINPISINNLFSSMAEHYPVKLENLPDIPEFINIQSKQLPEHYAVVSQDSFSQFIMDLESSVDLITRNEFISKHKINSHSFDIS